MYKMWVNDKELKNQLIFYFIILTLKDSLKFSNDFKVTIKTKSNLIY